MQDFGGKCGILQEKMHDLGLNGRFSKRKCVILGFKGDLAREIV